MQSWQDHLRYNDANCQTSSVALALALEGLPRNVVGFRVQQNSRITGAACQSLHPQGALLCCGLHLTIALLIALCQHKRRSLPVTCQPIDLTLDDLCSTPGLEEGLITQKYC